MKKGLPFEVAAQKVQVLVSGTGEVFDMWRCCTCGTLWYFQSAASYCHASSRNCIECGSRTDKLHTHCKACRDLKTRERWEALPEVEWDGETPLVLNEDSTYFRTPDDLYEYCDEGELGVKDLMLVVCTHVRPPCFSIDDFLNDILPDGLVTSDFGIDVAEVERVVNEAAAMVASKVWEHGGTRPSLASLREHLEDLTCL